MQSPPVIKEGSLMIHHGGLMGVSWKPCYFSLQRAYLHVYETKESSTPIENIVRSSITRAGQTGAPGLCRFEVEFSHRNKMILQGSSEEIEKGYDEVENNRPPTHAKYFMEHKLEVKQWVHALMWHLLPADIRDTVPAENSGYSAPPAYDDVVQEQNSSSHSSPWPCCIC